MYDLTVVEKPAEWDRLKQMVLDSVSSPITRRVCNMALNEFMTWFQQAPRPGFTKATVSAWRVSLEERRLGSSSFIIRTSAIRKLAADAADNAFAGAGMGMFLDSEPSVPRTSIQSIRLSQTEVLNLITSLGGCTRS